MSNNNLYLPAAKVQSQQSAQRSSNTTTAQYTGPWTTAEVTHLLRRTMFGATKADIDHMMTLTLDQAVNELLNNVTTTPSPPVNNYGTAQNPDPNIPVGATWINDYANYGGVVINGRQSSIQSWWIGNMLSQGISLEQKMTLFWHNHFATQLSVVVDGRFAYKMIETMRTNALGNFKTLAKAISVDPAMLKYLNGNSNTKNAPDENYARELQELFTQGKGPNSQYTQADVEAAARVLTGFRYADTSVTSYFDSSRHDTNTKQFSAYYNSTVIYNAGNGGADELSDLIDMMLSTNECAMYLSRRLYRFFVYYDIDSTIEANIITPMAVALRNNNYDIKSVLSLLLKSEHFFDTANRGCLIKPPIDYHVGMMRQMQVAFPDNTDIVTQYAMWKFISKASDIAGQAIFDPPNVAGWPAYYQVPQFHEIWINTNTLPSRVAFADTMMTSGYTHGGQTICIDVIAFTASMPAPDDPVALIDDVLSILLSMEVDQSLRDYLKTILLSTQATNAYWTTAWNNYIAAPTNTAYRTTILNRLKPFYQYILDLPEYQLQ